MPKTLGGGRGRRGEKGGGGGGGVGAEAWNPYFP